LAESLIQQILRFSRFYYRLLGRRLYLLLSLMAAGVAFEGLSVSLLLPILRGDDEGSQFVIVLKDLFAYLGLPYSHMLLLVFVAIFFFVRSAFLILSEYQIGKSVTKILVQLRVGLVKLLFRSSFESFTKRSAGELMNVTVVETNNVVASFTFFCAFVINILLVSVYTLIPALMHPKLILALLVLGVPFVIVSKRLNVATRELSLRSTFFNGQLKRIMVQAIQQFKYLKGTSTHPKVTEKIKDQCEELGRNRAHEILLFATTKYGFEPFIVLVIVALLYYQVYIRNEGLADAIFFLGLLFQALRYGMGVQVGLRKWLSTWGGFDAVTRLEDELARELSSIKESGESEGNFDFAKPIEFKRVSLKYSNGLYALKDISLTISPGTSVAFVGESGAGKTSIVNLLLGLSEPSDGSIDYGGVRLKGPALENFRRNVGYITQEVVVFNDTVEENIMLWEIKSPENLALARRVAKDADILSFIERLPDGFNSILGEHGIDMSGGQRQRLALAREFFKGSPLLIFDEATSALDSQTEQEIFKAVETLRGRKTMIIIAHRLSTVLGCDRIFVLKDGQIVEQGTFKELYGSGGLFRQMVDLQRVNS
jgi:ABC-type multidrug transport system fused ATPase/permease subunit